MKVRYEGKSFGIDSLTDGKVYDVVGVNKFAGALRVVDDSGEDYLYHPNTPKPLCAKESYGRFIIVEDDDKQTLWKAQHGIYD